MSDRHQPFNHHLVDTTFGRIRRGETRRTLSTVEARRAKKNGVLSSHLDTRRTRDDRTLVLQIFERLVEEGHAIFWIKSEGDTELILRDGATFALVGRGVRRIR